MDLKTGIFIEYYHTAMKRSKLGINIMTWENLINMKLFDVERKKPKKPDTEEDVPYSSMYIIMYKMGGIPWRSTAFMAGDTSSIPGQETKILQAIWHNK